MEDAVYGSNNPSFGHFTAPAIISLLVKLYNNIKIIKQNMIKSYNTRNIPNL